MTKALVVLAKLTRLYGALSVALFTLTTPVFAQTDSSPRDVFIESGDNAYANGNYRLALIVYTQSCRYGSATACVRAGIRWRRVSRITPPVNSVRPSNTIMRRAV